MTRMYKVSGMTCDACRQVVHDSLSEVEGVKGIDIDLEKGLATLELEKQIPTVVLRKALSDTMYEISEIVSDAGSTFSLSAGQLQEQNRRLVFDYITAVGRKDYDQLLNCLHVDFEFDGGMKLNSASDYVKMLKEHTAGQNVEVLKNDVKAVFVDGNEAYAIYEVATDKPVDPVSFLEQINIEEGKIKSTKVKFDRYGMRQLTDHLRNEKTASLR